MSATLPSLVATTLCACAALLWTVVASQSRQVARTVGLRIPLSYLIPVAGHLVATYYIVLLALRLVPPELITSPPIPVRLLQTLNLVLVVAIVPVVGHSLRYFPLDKPPSAAWLAGNYGPAVLLIVVGLGGLIPAVWLERSMALYYVLTFGNHLRRTRPLVRRGTWSSGSIGVPRSADIVVFACVLLIFTGLLVFLMLGSGKERHVAVVDAAIGAIGILVGLPSAMRMLGDVVRGVVVTSVLLLATLGLYLGLGRARDVLAPEGLGSLVDLAAVLGILFVLLPGQAWLRDAIDRVLLRRSRSRQAELQTFVRTLSLRLGPAECGRLALAELARVLQLPGVALMLVDGTVLTHGALDAEMLRSIWKIGDGIAGRLSSAVVGVAFSDLPEEVREGLIEARVVAVLPVSSPRRTWGHLLVRTSLVGGMLRAEDLQVVVTFLDELGLVLAGAELLARSVAVERSLAQAEKLAAIGELAARIAHEIRNPITAARSLAQQLAREPASPFVTEHEVILGELERVERLVADLLRFARREELRREHANLATIVAATVGDLRAGLEASGVTVSLALDPDVTGEVDREKIRQVLINLIENARDSLVEANGSRRLEVALDRKNGSAWLCVTDSGPGVPADALPRLFEPFFSLKPHGTGLGLAIVKRAIEAHGGRITAQPAAEGSGLRFDIELPLATVGPEGARG